MRRIIDRSCHVRRRDIAALRAPVGAPRAELAPGRCGLVERRRGIKALKARPTTLFRRVWVILEKASIY